MPYRQYFSHMILTTEIKPSPCLYQCKRPLHHIAMIMQNLKSHLCRNHVDSAHCNQHVIEIWAWCFLTRTMSPNAKSIKLVAFSVLNNHGILLTNEFALIRIQSNKSILDQLDNNWLFFLNLCILSDFITIKTMTAYIYR